MEPDSAARGWRSAGDRGGGRRNLIVGGGIAAAVLLGAAGGLWWALSPKAPPVIGSPEAVADGERFAAELVDGDDAITGEQTVASRDLFHYGLDEESLADGADGRPFIADQLVVSMKKDAGLPEVRALADGIGARVVGVNAFVDRYQLLLDERLTDAELADLAEELSSKKGVESVDRNSVFAVSREADDFGTEWEDSWGSALAQSDAGNWGMQALGAPAIWDYADANPDALSPVTAGVIDLFYEGDEWHPDLPNPLVPPLVPSGDRGDGDDSWHGAHVTGTITTRLDRPTGVRGVAPNGRVVASTPDHVRDGDASEFWSQVSIEDAMTFGVESGAKVLNLSFGAGVEDARKAQEGDQGARDRISQWAAQSASFLNRLLDSNDFLVVKAAGNASCTAEQVDALAGCTREGISDAAWSLKGAAEGSPLADRLITVGASTHLDALGGFEVAWYSDAGADIAAPGTGIRSAWSAGESDDAQKHRLDTGTSMAAPHISGLALSLFGTDPDLTASEVKRIILGTANTDPQLWWNDADNILTSLPSVNGAAAFQVALAAAELKGDARAGFLREVAERAVSAGETKLSPQLLGTWCRTADDGSTTESCFSLQHHLEADGALSLEQGDGESGLTAAHASGASTTAATLRLCESAECADSHPQVRLRYFPPGAASDVASDDPAHDVAYPRLAEIAWGDDGHETVGEIYRLAVGVEGRFEKLPFEPRTKPAITAQSLDGRWFAAGEGISDVRMTISGKSVHFARGAVQDILFPDAAEPDGSMMLTAIAQGRTSCTDVREDEFGSPCMPLGLLVPAGVPVDIPAFYGISDQPDQDRIWNPQSGELLLRIPTTAPTDLPVALQGRWCAKGKAKPCFSWAELLDEHPTAFVSDVTESVLVPGATDFSLCLMQDSEHGCTTAASMLLRYFPAGTGWDCDEAAKNGRLPSGFAECEPSTVEKHDVTKSRLIILPNHQHDQRYIDSIPMYRE